MENEHLRVAIKRSGLTLEEFADIVEVDVKTVQRWLKGRTPYARLRAKAAGALDRAEHELWPDTVPRPTESLDAGRPIPAVTDVVAGYGHATDPGAPNPADVLHAADQRIELIISNVTSGIVELLLAKAADGCQVRVIIEDPDPEVEPLLGIDGIEIRASPGGEEFGLHRADDRMLLVIRRIGVLSEPSPVIVLQRRTSAGLFDRLSEEFEERWDQTTPLPTRDRLHAYLAEVELEPWTDEDPDPEPGPPPQTRVTPTILDPNAPRRWPRRPT